jgi:disulfide oxidoreductase YuzD
VKKKNPIAKDLRTPKYRSRVIPNKKHYNRKDDKDFYTEMKKEQEILNLSMQESLRQKKEREEEEMIILIGKEIKYPPFHMIYPINILNNVKNIESPRLDLLLTDIKENGLKYPIICVTGEKLIDGHKRVAVAKQLGYNHISGYYVQDEEFLKYILEE